MAESPESSRPERSDSKSVPVCEVPQVPVRELDPSLDPGRVELIRNIEKKWVNGTVLHYHFLEGHDRQQKAVRDAFKTWQDLRLGIQFVEVAVAADAEIRIGFEPRRSWSYIGRDALGIKNPSDPTMNFGWDLTDSYGRDTALHEIGHALGFPHEHQNPNAGIVWDEPAVIAHFADPPNKWPEETTRHNVLRKLDSSGHEGSGWDRDSIMHYQFAAGLILDPAEYQRKPLIPEAGLSSVDSEQARRFYPASSARVPALQPYQSQRIDATPGDQLDFMIKPQVSRSYTIQTFGPLDTVMVLFEHINGEPRFYAGDDDSGTDLNASITARLFSARDYALRLRLYYAQAPGEAALMMW